MCWQLFFLWRYCYRVQFEQTVFSRIPVARLKFITHLSQGRQIED